MKFLPSTHPAGFDEHDVSAHWRPHKPDSNARLLDALLNFLLRTEFRHTQILANDLRCNHHLFRVAFGELARLLSRNRRNLPLEVSHARFSREAVDNLPQRLVREFNLLSHFDPMFLGLFGDQIAVRDVDLLLTGVSGRVR